MTQWHSTNNPPIIIRLRKHSLCPFLCLSNNVCRDNISIPTHSYPQYAHCPQISQQTSQCSNYRQMYRDDSASIDHFVATKAHTCRRCAHKGRIDRFSNCVSVIIWRTLSALTLTARCDSAVIDRCRVSAEPQERSTRHSIRDRCFVSGDRWRVCLQTYWVALLFNSGCLRSRLFIPISDCVCLFMDQWIY